MTNLLAWQYRQAAEAYTGAIETGRRPKRSMPGC